MASYEALSDDQDLQCFQKGINAGSAGLSNASIRLFLFIFFFWGGGGGSNK